MHEAKARQRLRIETKQSKSHECRYTGQGNKLNESRGAVGHERRILYVLLCAFFFQAEDLQLKFEISLKCIRSRDFVQEVYAFSRMEFVFSIQCILLSSNRAAGLHREMAQDSHHFILIETGVTIAAAVVTVVPAAVIT
jgi:hypothetical protein